MHTYVHIRTSHHQLSRISFTVCLYFLRAQVDKDAGRKTPYFPTFYGDLLGPFHDQGMAEAREMDQNLTFRLVYRATHTQQSLITLTFTADSVSFVENW